VIASISGRLVSKGVDRVIVQTTGGVGYEVVVPLGVMERLPAAGEAVTLTTELVVREDDWALYGFLEPGEQQLFQRLLTVSGVGPRIAVALLSTLGAERGARAIQKKDVAVLTSVSGIGKKLAERLALELGDKLGELGSGAPPPVSGPAEAALHALERLGYGAAEAERALRQALAGDGGSADTEALVRRALRVLTTK
jgi:Holliday junction DNA helicase RuvA